MAINTKIEWCDHTANAWWGCIKVHAGCDNCYAEALSKRFGNELWGHGTKRQRIKSFFPTLKKLQNQAFIKGKKETVFVGSMMDIFEKSMLLINPTDIYDYTGEIRADFFSQIDRGLYPNLIFLLLTKRPSNINKMIPDNWVRDGAPDNVWFGTSPVDQITFNNLVPMLCQVKGNRFLSVEPQLGSISIYGVYKDFSRPFNEDIQWIIQGGESGPKRRPFDTDWAINLRAECEGQLIPYFFKQIDKVQPIPDNLLIREFPQWQKTYNT